MLDLSFERVCHDGGLWCLFDWTVCSDESSRVKSGEETIRKACSEEIKNEIGQDRKREYRKKTRLGISID